jgi:hypothetical protein
VGEEVVEIDEPQYERDEFETQAIKWPGLFFGIRATFCALGGRACSSAA